MQLFRRKPKKDSKEIESQKGITNVQFDSSILRKNNITRLSIDERWTKLFVTIQMPPELKKSEEEMNELIKKEAMLKNEQENLEPQKRKCMKQIMSLTKEAFENDNEEAKKKLKECKKEIERINDRTNNILEDIEELEEEMREANLELLNRSINYIFSTLKVNNERALQIKKSLQRLKKKENCLARRWRQYRWIGPSTQLTYRTYRN